MIDLSGQHIFIAGGSRGIGAAAAKLAASQGAAVSVNYLSNQAAAQSVVDEILASGGRAAAFQGDVSEDGVAKRVVGEAVETLGPLTGCVISAGVFEGKALEEMDLAFWERTMRVNVTGTFLTTQACVPHLKKSGGGSVVIYTSTAGQRGSDIFSAYATSKGAQILFMRSMARELGGAKIRVNAIAPAWTETDMAAASLDSLGREEVAKSFVLGRIGLPEDVAGCTVFLLSELSCFVTGVTLTCDGGMDMRG